MKKTHDEVKDLLDRSDELFNRSQMINENCAIEKYRLNELKELSKEFVEQSKDLIKIYERNKRFQKEKG